MVLDKVGQPAKVHDTWNTLFTYANRITSHRFLRHDGFPSDVKELTYPRRIAVQGTCIMVLLSDGPHTVPASLALVLV